MKPVYFRLSGKKRLPVLLLNLILLFILCLTSAGLQAQGDVRFGCTTTKDGHALAGANVNITMDGHDFKSLTTGKTGRFKVDLDMGHQYRINFSAPGCVDMFMTLDFRVPPDKMGLYPAYAIEVPFFEPTSKTVRVAKYKDQPFAKVIFNGKDGFEDDPNYKFTDNILVDPAEEARKKAAILAEEERKAKEEADRIAKEEADRKAKEEAERKALEEAVAKAKDAESKRKAEEALKAKEQETMETEAMRLEREKQDKAALEKKNRTIKTQYENDLLKMVAESEKQANLQRYNKMKDESQANSVIQTLRKEAELKAASELLRQMDKEKQQKTLENKQVKSTQMKKLVEAAALTQKTIRVANSSNPDPKKYSHVSRPNVVVSLTEGILSDIHTTVITNGSVKNVFKKEVYIWGSTYYYKNNVEVDEKTYTNELAKLSK